MFKLTLASFVLFSGLVTVNCSRILMVFNHFGKSHYIQGRALGHGLAKAGHDVTMISPFEDSVKVRGYKEIVLDDIMKTVAFNTNFVNGTNMNPIQQQFTINSIFTKYTETTVNHTKFQTLLKSNQKFDVIILEDLYNGALRALSWYYKAPLILFSPFAPTIHLLRVSGNPAPPSYVPSIWMGFSHHMNFWQRSMNTFVVLFENLLLHFMDDPVQQDIIEKYFPDCPDLESLNKNISLFLINNHESINSPIPHVPTMVNILGFHLKTENKLPKDLQEYMDGAKDGVILFSFGSFVHPSKMDSQIKQSFLNSLVKLKQKILWKTDEEIVPGKPENVKLSKWLPQEDILAHPNCKLFITHAGFVSTVETIYHAVPVLAVPLAGDQELNAARMVELGVGLTAKLSELTEEKLDSLINELLNNEKYRQMVKERSELIRDRPVRPMDLAIYWVEYVMRHKNVSHMKVAGLDLNWYQYLLLDVLLVWSLIVCPVIVLVFIFLKRMLSRRSNKVKIN